MPTKDAGSNILKTYRTRVCLGLIALIFLNILIILSFKYFGWLTVIYSILLYIAIAFLIWHKISDKLAAKNELERARPKVMAKLHEQMLTSARQAGMNEVAANVLHNVGNVLNSVNVSTAIITEKINHSALKSLVNLGKILHEHQADLADFLIHDVKGSKIPLYMIKLGEHWEAEHAEIDAELNTLTENVHHIKDIITVQQSYGMNAGFEQETALVDMIDHALNIVGLVKAKSEIKISKEYQSLKPILIDKIKLLQVLVNVFRNAKDSLIESGRLSKTIEIKLIRVGKTVQIDVTDNGLGIAAENLTRIFSYGFTTKESGHGYGLHSCAIALEEMKGKIHINSPGVGQGATITILLPYRRVKK